jgi:hypothetical protein
MNHFVKMTVFWDAAPCNLVDIGRRYRIAYCLHHQGDHCPLHGAAFQKIAVFIFIAVRTLNLHFLCTILGPVSVFLNQCPET